MAHIRLHIHLLPLRYNTSQTKVSVKICSIYCPYSSSISIQSSNVAPRLVACLPSITSIRTVPSAVCPIQVRGLIPLPVPTVSLLFPLTINTGPKNTHHEYFLYSLFSAHISHNKLIIFIKAYNDRRTAIVKKLTIFNNNTQRLPTVAYPVLSAKPPPFIPAIPFSFSTISEICIPSEDRPNESSVPSTTLDGS